MNPIIRAANIRDKDQILSLLNLVFKNQQRSTILRGDDYWNWKFLDSPFGLSRISVAEHEGRIVAANNMWPWEFIIRGERHKALQPCDSVVHPDARGMGLFKSMRLFDLSTLGDEKPSFLFNFPNSRSINAYLSLGWSNVGEISWQIKVLNPFKVSRRILSKEVKTEPVDLYGSYKIEADRLDGMAQASPSYDSYVNINRVEGFHKYRYVIHPNRSYGMVIYEKGSQSTAAVFTLNQKGPGKEMIIVDLVGNPKYGIYVLKESIKAARSLNADVIGLIQNSKYLRKDLWKLGFMKKKEKSMVVLPLDTRLEHLAKDFSYWNLTACLHDSI